mgnify:CR=1 FL=1
MHRDLKFDNFKIGPNDTLKISGFDLAREIMGEEMYLKRKYSLVGTPLYASH